jgi:phosphoserine aminotransferase
MAYLNFKWIKSIGGVEELERRNIEKAKMLYNYIDDSDFYVSKISKNVRSRVNCVFTLKDETLNNEFIAQSKALGLVGLKGHKVLGGMRASIYNAMPIEGVKKLVEFMDKFEKENA